MIKNKSRVNYWGKIREGLNGSTSTYNLTRWGCVGCARSRRGDSRRAHRQTWTALERLFGYAGGCSFWYRPFGYLGAFIRPRIGLTVAFFDLIRVFLGKATALRGFDFGVCRKSVGNWTGVWGIQRSSSVSEIPKSLQICSSVSECASVQNKVGDIRSCGCAGCGNVAEHSICRVFRGHLRLTCVEMYNIFRKLDKIYYKFPHLGCFEVSWLIERRVEVVRRALLIRLNSNRCCRSFVWFHRLWCR